MQETLPIIMGLRKHAQAAAGAVARKAMAAYFAITPFAAANGVYAACSSLLGVRRPAPAPAPEEAPAPAPEEAPAPAPEEEKKPEGSADSTVPAVDVSADAVLESAAVESSFPGPPEPPKPPKHPKVRKRKRTGKK